MALYTINTDSDMMMLFMSHLTKILAKENPGFRDDTIFLLDGAAYHKSKETRTFYDQQKLKIMLSAAYSWSGAVCENFYGYFKQG